MYIFFGSEYSGSATLIGVLSSIYGLGYSRSIKLINELGIYPSIKLDQLTNSERLILQNLAESKYKLGRLLKLENKSIYDETIRSASYFGSRLRQGLPLRGQRTHSNANTARRMYRSMDVKKNII